MTKAPRLLQRSVVLNVLFAVEGGSMFLLDIVLASALGVGIRSDSLYAAWMLPQTIGRGAFQSLTNSLLGLFSEVEDANVAYNQAMTVIGITALAATLVMSLTAIYWFPLTVPGAPRETQVIGAPLAMILSWLVVTLALAETQRAIFYRLDRIYYPSAIRVIGAVVAIVVILFSARGQNLIVAAYGLVLGAAIEMVLGFAGLLWVGIALRPTWPPASRLHRMARVVGLPLLGQGVFITASATERAIASFLGPGAVTAVTYAGRIFQMMERFVFRGFVIATIQTYTAGIRSHWRRDTRMLILISIPMFVIFAVMPVALITVVFARGRFTAESAELVGQTLRAYALAIPVVAFNRVPYALAFARRKSRELFLFALIYMGVLIGTEALLIFVFDISLAAFGIAYFLAVVIATAWLYPRVTEGTGMPRWSAREVLSLVSVGLLALLGTALIVFGVQAVVHDPKLSAWITVLAGGSASVLLTALGVWLLRLPEAQQVTQLLRGEGR